MACYAPGSFVIETREDQAGLACFWVIDDGSL